MAGKEYPWVLATVPWSGQQEFTRGTHDGLPLLSYGCAPRHLLATYRQLRAQGLRPGGQDPAAVLYLYSKVGGRKVFANLYLISKALPVRPMTAAKWHALNKANLARRECPVCHRDRGYVIHPTFGKCFVCVEADDAEPSTSNGVAA